MTFLDKIKETAAFLKEKGILAPEFGLILGSGLGELAEEIENPVVVDYADIPNWGRSTVVGHAGKWYMVTLQVESLGSSRSLPFLRRKSS